MLAEVERVGPEAFKAADIVKRFNGRGTSRTSLFKWVACIVGSGKPGGHLARVVRQAAAERAARSPEPAKDAAVEAVELLPRKVSLAELTGFSPTTFAYKLNSAIADAAVTQRSENRWLQSAPKPLTQAGPYRLYEIVTAGNWLCWFTASGAIGFVSVRTKTESGTACPLGALT